MTGGRRQDARIDAANLGEVQEAIGDHAGHHQADGIHVGGEQDAQGGARRRCPCASRGGRLAC